VWNLEVRWIGASRRISSHAGMPGYFECKCPPIEPPSTPVLLLHVNTSEPGKIQWFRTNDGMTRIHRLRLRHPEIASAKGTLRFCDFSH
jgi:hypothetical protein